MLLAQLRNFRSSVRRRQDYCTTNAKQLENKKALTRVFYSLEEEIRTPDLCRARAALSQLSYIPVFKKADTSGQKNYSGFDIHWQSFFIHPIY